VSASESNGGSWQDTNTPNGRNLYSLFREDEVEPLTGSSSSQAPRASRQRRARPRRRVRQPFARRNTPESSAAAPLRRFDTPAAPDVRIPPAAVISRSDAESLYGARQSLLYDSDEAEGGEGTERPSPISYLRRRSRAGAEQKHSTKAGWTRTRGIVLIAAAVVATVVVMGGAPTGRPASRPHAAVMASGRSIASRPTSPGTTAIDGKSGARRRAAGRNARVRPSRSHQPKRHAAARARALVASATAREPAQPVTYVHQAAAEGSGTYTQAAGSRPSETGTSSGGSGGVVKAGGPPCYIGQLGCQGG
jgi:hypothetical protein